jgi:hypothetical protein
MKSCTRYHFVLGCKGWLLIFGGMLERVSLFLKLNKQQQTPPLAEMTAEGPRVAEDFHQFSKRVQQGKWVATGTGR